jgi:hypothetical protein
MICPKCGAPDGANVIVQGVAVVNADGVAEISTDRPLEWDKDSLAFCGYCGHMGLVSSFQEIWLDEDEDFSMFSEDDDDEQQDW